MVFEAHRKKGFVQKFHFIQSSRDQKMINEDKGIGQRKSEKEERSKANRNQRVGITEFNGNFQFFSWNI